MSHRGNPAGRLRAGGPPDREDVRRPEKGPKGKYDQPEGDDEWIAKDEDWSDDYEDEKPQKGHDGHHRQYNEGKDDRYKKEDSYRGDPKRYRGARDYQDDPQASEERGRNNKSYAENHYREERGKPQRIDPREDYDQREAKRRDYREDDHGHYKQQEERPKYRGAGYDYHGPNPRAKEQREPESYKSYKGSHEDPRNYKEQDHYEEERRGERRRSNENRKPYEQGYAANRKRKQSDTDNYRFNNPPHADRPNNEYSGNRDYDHKYEPRPKEERYRRDKDENNYKFRKNAERNEYNVRPKKSTSQDDDNWLENDSQDEDDHEEDHHKERDYSADRDPANRNKDGLKKPFNKASKVGSMMKGWQKNIDNFGYIERKQFGKVSEGKPTGTIYRGQHYFVRIDESNNKGHSKGSSYARGGRDREETPEYKPKE